MLVTACSLHRGDQATMNVPHSGMDTNTDARLARKRTARAVSGSHCAQSHFSDVPASVINAEGAKRSAMALSTALLAKPLGIFDASDRCRRRG